MNNQERAREIYKIILRDELDQIVSKATKIESSRTANIRKVSLEKLKLRAQEIEEYFEAITNKESAVNELSQKENIIEQLTKELETLQQDEFDQNNIVEENEKIKKLHEELLNEHKKTEPFAKIVENTGLSEQEIRKIQNRVKERYDTYEDVYYKTKKITDIENDTTKTPEQKEQEISKIANELYQMQSQIKKIEDQMKKDAAANDKISQAEKAIGEIYKIHIDMRPKKAEYDKAIKEIKEKQLEEKTKKTKEQTEKLEQTKKEVAELKTKIKEYDQLIENVNENIEMKGFLENGIVKRETKIEKIKEQIAALEKMRDKVKSSKEQSKINKRINKKKQKMEKIRRNKATIEDVQRIVMLPKRKLSKLRGREDLTAQAKYNVSERSLKEIETKKAKLNPDSKIDALKMMVYNIQEKHYQNKKDRAKEVLEDIKKNKKQTTASGGNAVSLAKEKADKLRAKLKRSAINQMTAPQQPVATASARTR